MEDIVRQVQRARRRLNWEQFLRIAPWTLFAALIVALVALAVPKLWVVAAVESDEGWNRWMIGWLGGSFVVGLVAAAIWTWVKRHETFSAAVELDRRFGLKERVASSLALSAEERETEIGRALLDDAAKRVSTLEVGDRFQVRLGWQAALPVLPLVAGLLLALVANATAPPSKSLASDDQAKKASDQVKKSTDELKKKLEEERKKAEEAGLEEVDDLFKKLQEGLDKLQTKEKLDRK
ncbi:MAG TPA: hypothetical protein PLV92_07540, partial [Pirellulaceae bacterium]|nr:hypothetical protein [Pirellulaceae bacterium]